MTTPLAATERLDFPIIVDGLTHHLRCYCSTIPGAGITGRDMVMKDGTLGTDISSCIEAYLTLVHGGYQASVSSFAPVTLQHLSSGAWLPTVVYTPTTTPSGTGNYVKAGQITLTLRDTAFHHVRQIFLEQEEPVGERVVPPGTGLYATFFTAMAGPVIAGSTDPANWLRGRSNLYIAGAISFVTDLNDKIRRRRGTA